MKTQAQSKSNAPPGWSNPESVAAAIVTVCVGFPFAMVVLVCLLLFLPVALIAAVVLGGWVYIRDELLGARKP